MAELSLSEKLGTDDFGVTLASRPQSNVLINLNLTDGDAGPSDMAIDASQVLFYTRQLECSTHGFLDRYS